MGRFMTKVKDLGTAAGTIQLLQRRIGLMIDGGIVGQPLVIHREPMDLNSQQRKDLRDIQASTNKIMDDIRSGHMTDVDGEREARQLFEKVKAIGEAAGPAEATPEGVAKAYPHLLK